MSRSHRRPSPFRRTPHRPSTSRRPRGRSHLTRLLWLRRTTIRRSSSSSTCAGISTSTSIPHSITRRWRSLLLLLLLLLVLVLIHYIHSIHSIHIVHSVHSTIHRTDSRIRRRHWRGRRRRSRGIINYRSRRWRRSINRIRMLLRVCTSQKSGTRWWRYRHGLLLSTITVSGRTRCRAGRLMRVMRSVYLLHLLRLNHRRMSLVMMIRLLLMLLRGIRQRRRWWRLLGRRWCSSMGRMRWKWRGRRRRAL